MSRQRPAATAADAAGAQGQVGLRQGRGLHLGHQHLFPREHVRFQEKLKKAQFFCQVCYTMPVENLCISEASLHFRRPAPTWSMRKRVTYRAGL